MVVLPELIFQVVLYIFMGKNTASDLFALALSFFAIAMVLALISAFYFGRRN